MYLFNSRPIFNSAPHAECNLIFFLGHLLTFLCLGKAPQHSTQEASVTEKPPIANTNTQQM